MHHNIYFEGGKAVRIIEDANMLENGTPYKVNRSWKERLFTLPWRPWNSKKTIIPQIPRKDVLVCQDQYIMHPTVAAEFRRQIS